MAAHRFRIAFLAISVGVLIAFSAAAEQGTARQVIDRFNGALVDVMKNADSLGYDGRFERLTPVVEDSFNMAFMARFTSWPYWKDATQDQRKRFVAAFSAMTVATYASRFDDYTGEQFETSGEEQAPRNTILVKSTIIKSNGDKVAINYLLRQFKGQWRIIDIHLRGTVSELATRRSEYADILKRKGVDGLTAALNKKVAALAATGKTP